MSVRRGVWVVLAALPLVGGACSALPRSSVPVHYYALDVKGPAAKAAGERAVHALAVARLVASAAYGERIYYRGRDCTAGYYEGERWVEAPAEMVTRALERTLRESGAARAVGRESLLRDADLLLGGELVSFDIVRDARECEAVCEVQLVLRDLRSRTVVWAGRFAARRPVRRPAVPVAGPKVHAMVEAMNDAVGEAIAAACEGVGKALAGLPGPLPAAAK
jgi:ABC-type uncharacterized transport system auxiliary subunit